jgi:hypothetical protein
MIRLLPLLFLLCLLPSCQSVRKLIKAKPADFSAFIERPQEMQRQPSNTAFQFLWRSRDRAAHAAARPLTDLYIAPVTLRYLRPMSGGLTKFNQSLTTNVSPEAPHWSNELRHQFALALVNMQRPHYRIVTTPTPNCLILEMAIVELNPTSPKTNAGKLAAKLILGPIGTVGGLAVQSSGNIALEAKVRLHRDRKLLFQFSDNESDKLTFYSIRDFRPYGHVNVAIQEWAEQFAELTENRPGTPISDASFWTLSPF